MIESTATEQWEPAVVEEPEEGGLRIGVVFIVLTVATVVAAGLCFLGDLRLAAGAIMGVWGLSVVVASPRVGVVLALSTQIWDQALNPAEGGGYEWVSPGRVLAIVTLMSYGLRVLMGHRVDVHRTRRALWLFAAFAAWSVMSATWARFHMYAAWTSLKIVIQVALLLVAVDLLSHLKTIRQTLVLMTIGGATGGLFVLFSGIALRASGETRLALPGVGINALAISLGVIIIAGVALLLLRRSVFLVTLISASVITMLLVSFRAGTRSVLVGVPLAVVAGALVGYGRQVHKLLLTVAVGVALTGGSLYWAVQSGFVQGKLRDRLLGALTAEPYQTNVRWELWTAGLRIYASNPIGTGAGNEPLGYAALGTRIAEAHNVFISILIEYNVIGLGMFIAAVAALGIAVLHMNNPALRAGAAMFLAFTLLTAVKGTTHETRTFWQPIMLTAVMIEAEFRLRQRRAFAQDSATFLRDPGAPPTPMEGAVPSA